MTNAIETRRFESSDDKLVVRMVETGVETAITTGDLFEIPPGHDAHVEGSDRVELILFEPPEHQH